MTQPPKAAKDIFLTALDIEPAERAAVLDDACAGDAALRDQVEALLRAHDEPDSLLDSSRIHLGLSGEGAAPDPDATLDQLLSERPGTQIGPYKLLQQIGEGGFGVVYMAEQTEPVERRVALKIIKPGMDTRQVIARFEAERQALAMMDHPNIAKVLDAGTTESGRPYFVMELVRGIPLTAYCDKNALSNPERLSLLIDVCHAIQHAHQKGVIHRDIKPSNVLITLQDHKPLVKVIDFGVSKAINQRLTEKTLFTAFGQMVGTPQYMSPEQAEMSGLDIDTRSDIYSLGVLMYELLTGTTPLDGRRLRSLGYAELQRVICEEEPPRPSNRISTLGEQSTSAAEHRSVNPKRLRDQLAGELDWIVMKALEKDRGRRYETATALASDIRHYLNNDAVEACPPSAAYRLRKFAARNRFLVRIAAAIGILLIAVIAINTALAGWAGRSERLSEERRGREVQLRTKAVESRQKAARQRRQTEAERDKARAAEAQAAAQSQIATAAEHRAQASFQQARRAVDEYLQTVSESALLLRPGMSPLRRQLLESARSFYQTIVERAEAGETPRQEIATARYRLGRILEEQGAVSEARLEYQAVRAGYEQLIAEQPNDPPLRLELADICRRLDDLPAAQRHCEALLENDAEHASAQRALAAVHKAAARRLASRQQMDAAVRRYAEAEQIHAALSSGDEPAASDLADLAETCYATAQVLMRQARAEDSLSKCRSGIDAAERARDRDPQTPRYGQLVATGLGQRARAERILQQTDQALHSYRSAESAWSRLVFEFPTYTAFKVQLARTRLVLADYQRMLGREQDAQQSVYRLEQFFNQQPHILPGDHYQLAVLYAQLADPDQDHAGQLSEEAGVSLTDYAAKAVEQLSLAVQAGYRGEMDLSRDPQLQPLAGRADFQAVAADSRERATAPPGSPTSVVASDLPHHLLMVASLRGIAAAQRELGQLEQAGRTLQQCLSELDQLPSGDGIAVLAERGKTMYALGHLHWVSRQYQQAKQAWDQGLDLVRKAHDQADEDKSELAQAIATEEWQLILVFGEIAIWDEAARHWDNYIESAPYMDARNESQVAQLSLVADGGERYEETCRYLASRFEPRDSPTLLGMLAQGEQAVIGSEELVELAKRERASPTTTDWSRCVLGLCQLRNGNAEDAALNLFFSRTFLRAQAIYLAGDHAAAKFWLELGERLYANSSRDWLGSRTLKSPDAGYWNWWEQAVQQASRQAAWQLIEQRTVPDPWACLFEARGYGLIGDAERSEAAFAETLEPPPEDSHVWLAAAETRAILGQYDEAERLFAKAVELASDDPEVWIASGKYYLERGLDEQADADMNRAAELASDDLDIFVRSGWWATGPYPQDIKRSFPPEESPHPARPVPRSDDDSLKNAAPRRWVRVPVDSEVQGGAYAPLVSRVGYDGHLTNYARNASAYFLTYVYSPDARAATLCIGGGYMWAANSPERQAQMRIRLNGEIVFDWMQSPYRHVALQRLPVQLKAGRNEILVRISSPVGHNFRFRLGDSPISQALLEARLGRWRQAIDAFHRIPSVELVQGGYSLASIYCACLAAADELQEYEEAVAKAFSYAAHTNEDDALASLLDTATLRQNPTMDGDALLAIVEELEEPTESWVRTYKGRAYLRADEFQQAIDWLSRHKLNGIEPWCITAMAHHELGHEPQAKSFLQKAKDSVLSQMTERRDPSPKGSKGLVLLVEAHQRITGVPLAEDPAWVSLREEIDAQLAEMPSETKDFDLALMLEPKQPRLWVARAQRYADLQRWEDAERDFAEAIRLDKQNAGTWLARARYWTRRGNLEEAQHAYDRVLLLDADSTNRQQALEDLQANVPLLLALLETRTGDADLWDACVTQLHTERRWSEAAEAWQRRVRTESDDLPLRYQLALLQLAAGDMRGYTSTCGNLLDQHAQDPIEKLTFLVSWACGLGPEACADYAPAIELAQRCRDHAPVNASIRITLGAVLLRGGRIAEAMAELEEGAVLAACDDERNGTPPAYAWYLLAIANRQAGNLKTARQWYEMAQRWTREQIESHSPRIDRWNRRLTLEVLERESEMLLEQGADPGG